jgi:hypothetical protein
MQKLNANVIQEGNTVALEIPECSDMTMHWRYLYNLALMIGHTASTLPLLISDPRQDEIETDKVVVYRLDDLRATISFRETTRKITWNRWQAMAVADKMKDVACDMAQSEHEKRTRI